MEDSRWIELRRPPRPGAEPRDGIPVPQAPGSVAETGLDPQLLLRFVLRSAYVTNLETAPAIADYVKLPEPVVEGAKGRRLVEVCGLVDPRRSVYRYALTGLGRDWAIDAFQQCRWTARSSRAVRAAPAPGRFSAGRAACTVGSKKRRAAARSPGSGSARSRATRNFELVHDAVENLMVEGEAPPIERKRRHGSGRHRAGV